MAVKEEHHTLQGIIGTHSERDRDELLLVKELRSDVG